MQALDFLEEVYGDSIGWVDLPAKVNGYWVPYYLEWPDKWKIADRRIASSVRDRENLYFSVLTFSEKGRSIDCANPADWLFADLDTVSPATCIRAGLDPTICWESSPGRFQALWKLTKVLDPQPLSQMNRLLTYALDADKGGWDLTQVLRLPGTRNYKYHGAPNVRLVLDDGPIYGPKTLLKRLRKLVPVEREREEVGEYKRLIRWEMPPKARALLRTPPDQVVVGERSDRLWEIECLLVEAGVPEEAIFNLIWPCAWNKHAEVNTGREALRREIARAVRHVTGQRTKDKVSVSPSRNGRVTEDEEAVHGDRPTLAPVSYGRFMAQVFPSPRWLVEDVWTAESHGIIGGEPKTSKSTLALALGLSVASGRPFLGRFPVHTTGPVLVVQEENADWVMQDRLARIAASYGLIGRDDVRVTRVDDPGLLGTGQTVKLEFPEDIDLHLVNHAGVDLQAEEYREKIEADIDWMKPALVIFDPLYLMLGDADENRSAELREFQKWFLELRYKSHCAIAVVHHFRKAQKDHKVRPGQQLLGSTTMHGWAESSLYVETRENDTLDPRVLSIKVTPEMRNMEPKPSFDVDLRMGEPGDLEFRADVVTATAVDEVVQMVGEGCSAAQLGKAMGISRQTARKRAEAAGLIVVKDHRGVWRILPRG